MKGLTDNIVTSFFPPLQSGYCTNNHSSSNCSCPKSQGNDLNSLAFHGNWLEIYAGSAIILSCSLLILCVSHVRRYLLSSTHYSSLKLYSSTSLFQKKNNTPCLFNSFRVFRYSASHAYLTLIV